MALPPNLSRAALDICKETGQGDFDLVYSVECFEHIEDDELAIANARTFLEPGGCLLIIVPFATPGQQQDPAFVEAESVHGHIRPGYDPTRLERLIGPTDFTEIKFEHCYWKDTGRLRTIKEAIAPAAGMEAIPGLEALARLDIRPGPVATGGGQANGIKAIAVGKR